MYTVHKLSQPFISLNTSQPLAIILNNVLKLRVFLLYIVSLHLGFAMQLAFAFFRNRCLHIQHAIQIAIQTGVEKATIEVEHFAIWGRYITIQHISASRQLFLTASDVRVLNFHPGRQLSLLIGKLLYALLAVRIPITYSGMRKVDYVAMVECRWQAKVQWGWVGPRRCHCLFHVPLYLLIIN